MPSRSDASTARCARTVISLARRINASSWASLIIRQPAVTGVPVRRRAAGAAAPISFANVKGIVSSMPMSPAADPPSLRIAATSANGLWSSSHGLTSRPIWICSRARASSKAGVTQAGSPSRVRTAPKNRSLSPHWAPVKYVRLVPDERTSAFKPSAAISSWARAMRRRCSSMVIGATPSVIGARAAIGAGTSAAAASPGAADATPETPTATDPRNTSRRLGFIRVW